MHRRIFPLNGSIRLLRKSSVLSHSGPHFELMPSFDSIGTDLHQAPQPPRFPATAEVEAVATRLRYGRAGRRWCSPPVGRADSEVGSVPSHRTWEERGCYLTQQWKCHGGQKRTCDFSRNSGGVRCASDVKSNADSAQWVKCFSPRHGHLPPGVAGRMTGRGRSEPNGRVAARRVPQLCRRGCWRTQDFARAALPRLASRSAWPCRTDCVHQRSTPGS